MSVKSIRKRSGKEANDDLTNDIELKQLELTVRAKLVQLPDTISIYVEQKNP